MNRGTLTVQEMAELVMVPSEVPVPVLPLLVQAQRTQAEKEKDEPGSNRHEFWCKE